MTEHLKTLRFIGGTTGNIDFRTEGRIISAFPVKNSTGYPYDDILIVYVETEGNGKERKQE